MTERQRKVRERGLARAREMNREYSITSSTRRDTMMLVKWTLILMAFAAAQTIYKLL